VKESYVIAEGERRPSVAEERQVGVYFTQKEGCKGTERASVLSMLFQSKRERIVGWWATTIKEQDSGPWAVKRSYSARAHPGVDIGGGDDELSLL